MTADELIAEAALNRTKEPNMTPERMAGGLRVLLEIALGSFDYEAQPRGTPAMISRGLAGMIDSRGAAGGVGRASFHEPHRIQRDTRTG